MAPAPHAPAPRLVPATTQAATLAGARAATQAATRAAPQGPEVAWLPPRSPRLMAWSPPAAGHVHGQTGGQLAVAGPLRYVVHAGCITAPTLELLAQAGLPVEAQLEAYDSDAGLLALLRRLCAAGLRLCAQRLMPEDELPARHALVAPGLLAWLNDKAALPALVPPAHLPRRRVLPVAALPDAARLLAGGPVVLKASTHVPSGGGHAVWVVRTPAEVEAVRERLAGEPRVVLEELLPIARTLCVHATVDAQGATHLWGAAEEIVEGTAWRGNWMDAATDTLPAGVLEATRACVEAAARHGYRGVAGVDVALCRDGRPPQVLDLNFRTNGSTTLAWLAPALRARGHAALGMRVFAAPAYARVHAAARAGLEAGEFLPLALYDPAVGAHGGLARLWGLVLGASRAQAAAAEARLRARLA
ncbi:MAG: ATP-grasp domain-containing protein [Planctomycetia bacterium]